MGFVRVSIAIAIRVGSGFFRGNVFPRTLTRSPLSNLRFL